MMDGERSYIRLADLTRMVGNAIRRDPELSQVWVLAELSDVRVVGGHCYMELVEKDDRGSFRAKLRAMIWSSSYTTLRRRFVAETGREISAGMKVLVRGGVTHHDVYGLSFVISDIDTSFTLGDMERVRREILARLAKEGVLENNRRLAAPELPQRIAVVSAAGAAGYGDFMHQIEQNEWGFRFYPCLFAATMQGDRTVPTVLDALDLVERTHAIMKWDCVVIIRGGGATADLNSFDNYELARRVATYPLPVAVGIGHERDRTVLDEIACVRCKTPTAVAALLLDRVLQSWNRVIESSRRIGNYVSLAMEGERRRLEQLQVSLPALVGARTMRQRMVLTEKASAIARTLAGKVPFERGRLEMYGHRMAEAPKRRFEQAAARLERTEAMIRVLSPDNTLRRGYSITRVNGRAVRDVAGLRPGDMIETTLHQGKVLSEVIDKNEEEEP